MGKLLTCVGPHMGFHECSDIFLMRAGPKWDKVSNSQVYSEAPWSSSSATYGQRFLCFFKTPASVKVLLHPWHQYGRSPVETQHLSLFTERYHQSKSLPGLTASLWKHNTCHCSQKGTVSQKVFLGWQHPSENTTPVTVHRKVPPVLLQEIFNEINECLKIKPGIVPYYFWAFWVCKCRAMESKCQCSYCLNF